MHPAFAAKTEASLNFPAELMKLHSAPPVLRIFDNGVTKCYLPATVDQVLDIMHEHPGKHLFI